MKLLNDFFLSWVCPKQLALAASFPLKAKPIFRIYNYTQLPSSLEDTEEQSTACSFSCVVYTCICSQQNGNYSKTQMLEPLKALPTQTFLFFMRKIISGGTEPLVFYQADVCAANIQNVGLLYLWDAINIMRHKRFMRLQRKPNQFKAQTKKFWNKQNMYIHIVVLKVLQESFWLCFVEQTGSWF